MNSIRALLSAGWYPAWTILAALVCGALIPASVGFGQSPRNADNSPAGTPAQGNLVVNGERFTARVVTDPEQGGLTVSAFAAPTTWRESSQVHWNYANYSSPVVLAAQVVNPTNTEAVFLWPAAFYFCVSGDPGYYRPGQNVAGLINMPPQPPAQAMLNIVRQIRGRQPQFRIVGTKDLPGLPKALRLPQAENQRGTGVKVTYELSGQAIEEEFYGVFFAVDIPYDGPQGRTWQRNWGFNALHSFRAPAGALESRRAVFAAIAKSFRPNPVWQERLKAIMGYLAEQFNLQLQAGYDAIAAAGRLSQQTSANNDALIATIDQRLHSSPSSRRSAEARSPGEKYDDYIRGVETVDDPYYGTSQHSSTEQYHWTDGYGSYRNSNAGSYDPNQHENGDWQLMPPAR